MEEGGYDVSGIGVIKREDRIIGRIEKVSVHIYPEEIFLRTEKKPATMPLMVAFLDPTVPKLEIVIEVGQFHYIAEGAKVNKAEFEAKKGEIVYIKEAEIIPLVVEKVPRELSGSLS